MIKQYRGAHRAVAARRSSRTRTAAASTANKYGMPLAVSAQVTMSGNAMPNRIIGKATSSARHPSSASAAASKSHAA